MTDHIVVFDGNERLTGHTVEVKIEEASAFTLFGTVLTEEHLRLRFALAEPLPAPLPISPSKRIGLPLV